MFKGMGKRIVRARKAAGKTRSELAAALDVDERKLIKYETDSTFVPDEDLIKMSDFLKIHHEFFFRVETVTLGKIEFNKSPKISKRDQEQVIEKVTEKAEKIFEVADILEMAPVPKFSIPQKIPSKIHSTEDAKSAAQCLMDEWGIVPGQKTIKILEAHGILVFEVFDVTAKFKGLATTINGLPSIVVHNRNFRQQQASIAHELGHIIFKGRLRGLSEEEACTAFAEVMTPAELEIWEDPPPLDRSTLLEDLTMRAFEEDFIPSTVAARLLGITPSDFQEILEQE